MRLVFAGTPAFAARALEAVLAAGHQVPAILCQPDRPAGRGQRLAHGPVKALAIERGLLVLQPVSLRAPAVQAELAQLDADVWVVAAYGLLLPPEVLALPRQACLNIHASLLPRWRGAAPIQRALLAGDTHTGIAIMRMEAGLDTGPVLRQAVTRIQSVDTSGSLHERLALLGAQLLVQSLAHLDHDLAAARPQSAEGIVYAAKVRKEEARLDWAQPALQLERVVRAFDPAPGARFQLGQELVHVGAAEARSEDAVAPGTVPGTVLDVGAGVRVATGAGTLRLLRLQRPAGRMLPAREFLQACRLDPGVRLG